MSTANAPAAYGSCPTIAAAPAAPKAARPGIIDRAEVVRALSPFLPPGRVTEVRAIDATAKNTTYQQTHSGYFDDVEKLAAAVLNLRSAAGVYFIPNAVHPALLARAVNRIRPVKKEPTTSDKDIVRRRFLLVDCDATRPAGISANGEEHDAALSRAGVIARDLALEGWYEPIYADSGNGGHLAYPVDEPNDEETAALFRQCLEALQAAYGDAAVKVDETVFNAARLWKLYGSRAGKGDDAEACGRPHRMAKVLHVPDVLTPVPRELLEDLAARAPSRKASAAAAPTPKGGNIADAIGSAWERKPGGFDIEGWIRTHGLDLDGPEAWSPQAGGTGKRWVFKVCPWDSGHTNRSAYLLQFPSGAVEAGCRHDSCKGRDWRSLREMYEPGRRDAKANTAKPAAAAGAAAPNPNDELSENWVKAVPFVPLDEPIAPPLPPDVFRHWAGEMIYAVAEATETPPDLAAAFVTVTTAAAAQRRFRLRLKEDYFQGLNTWMLPVLSSGNRKSGVVKATTGPLYEYERMMAAQILPEREKAISERKTMEARIGWMRDQAKKERDPQKAAELAADVAAQEANLPQIPEPPTLVEQDITPEHLATVMSHNDESMSLISDEPGSLFNQMSGQYNGGTPNLDIYLQSHESSPVKVSRGSRPPCHLYHPTLSIGVSPQVDVLAGLNSRPGYRGRGLLARFNYVVPVSLLGWRSGDGRPVPPHVTDAYRTGILTLAATPTARDGDRDVPHVLYFSGEAFEEWRAFQREVEVMLRPNGRLAHVTDWGGKLPAGVARIAGLLHLMDYTSCATTTRTIEPGTVARAVTYGRYLIAHAEIAFQIMGADEAFEVARHLWKAIEGRKRKKVTASEAWSFVRGRYKRMADVEGGFDLLCDHGYLFERGGRDFDAKRGKGRPPSRPFVVNPALASDWSD